MAHLTKDELQEIERMDPALVHLVRQKGDNLIRCDLCKRVMRVKSVRDSLCSQCSRLKPLINKYRSGSQNLSESERSRILDGKTTRVGPFYNPNK